MRVWTAVTADVKSPLVFVDEGVKLNQENYRTSILQSAFLPWAQKQTFSFQEDSAPAHEAKKTKEWLAKNVPAFI